MWIAADGFPGWHLLVVFVLGTILMRSAGVCVNDVADRRFDQHVQRTAARPVITSPVSARPRSGRGDPDKSALPGLLRALRGAPMTRHSWLTFCDSEH